MSEERLMDMARAGLLAFMKTRCDVSSQHKLPGRHEILDTYTAEFIGVPRAQKALDQLIAEGTIIVYGNCYYSDHPIDVL